MHFSAILSSEKKWQTSTYNVLENNENIGGNRRDQESILQISRINLSPGNNKNVYIVMDENANKLDT